jgi:sulfite reductase beta subunit-like hemoprotein
MIGKVIRDFLPAGDLLPYLEAIVATYNAARTARQQVQGAHQDHRARARGRALRELVEARFAELRAEFDGWPTNQLDRIAAQFAAPALLAADPTPYHAPATPTASSAPGPTPTCTPTATPTTPSSRSASRRMERRPGTPRPSRCA